ncbi:MAG: ester cyclase [Parvibaculaceae bacterium]|nr:ester cyclase [Parvibaculaceae bacterium]|tara:strand:- start:43 stop:483 length:441 start_codon:yes stop_codon:yes gene_type:complete
MSQQERNKALVRQLTEYIWNQADLAKIPDYYADDYEADYRPYAPVRRGHEAMQGMVERAHAAFSNYREELKDVLADGDKVVARFTVSGEQTGKWGAIPPTGKSVAFDEIVVLTLKDGKVTHQSGVADNVAALHQLGLIPMPGDAKT